MSDNACNIRVICRVRPFNQKEKDEGGERCVSIPQPNSIVLQSKPYNFDSVLAEDSTQEQAYEIAAKPIVNDVLNGINGTIFAYGQTASGKTFTMEGVLDDPVYEGILPRIINDIFLHIENMDPDVNIEFTLKVSYFEIYNEEIQDLIDNSKRKLSIHEDKDHRPYVKGLSTHSVSSPDEVLEIIEFGKSNRHIAVTDMNEHSSRSHSVFKLQVTQEDGETKRKLNGSLYLIDLAGSEKAQKTGAEGQTFQEAKKINLSLLMLGNVIKALVDKAKHIPYRDSKLTRILQESLGGNSRTTVVICCSPSSFNESETRSTLQFGARAKNIKNTISRNMELTIDEWKARYNKLKSSYRKIIHCLESVQFEINRWRNGEKVPESEWSKLTSLEKNKTLEDNDNSASVNDNACTADKSLNRINISNGSLEHSSSCYNNSNNEFSSQLLMNNSFSFPTGVPSDLSHESSLNGVSSRSSSVMSVINPGMDWEDEKQQLITSLDKKEEEYTKLQQDYEELQQNFNEVLEERNLIDERYTQTEDECEILRNNLSDTEREVDKSDEELKEIIKELNRLHTITENAQNENKRLTNSKEELENKLAREIQEKENISSQHVNFKTTTESILSSIIDQLGDLGKSLKLDKSPPSMIDTNNLIVQDSNEITTKLNIFFSYLKNSVEKLTQKQTHSEQKCKQLNEDLENNVKESDKLKSANKLNENKLTDIFNQLNSFSTSQENLRSPTLDGANSSSEFPGEHFDNQLSMLNSLKQQMILKDRCLNEFKDKLVEKDDEIGDLNSDKRVLTLDLEGKEKQLKSLKLNLKSKEEAKEQVNSLSRPLEANFKKMKGFRQELLCYLKENHKNPKVKSSEETKAKFYESMYEEINSVHKDKLKENEILSQECQILDTKNNAKEVQITTLKEELDRKICAYEERLKTAKSELESQRIENEEQKKFRGRLPSKTLFTKTLKVGGGNVTKTIRPGGSRRANPLQTGLPVKKTNSSAIPISYRPSPLETRFNQNQKNLCQDKTQMLQPHGLNLPNRTTPPPPPPPPNGPRNISLTAKLSAPLVLHSQNQLPPQKSSIGLPKHRLVPVNGNYSNNNNSN